MKKLWKNPEFRKHVAEHNKNYKLQQYEMQIMKLEEEHKTLEQSKIPKLTSSYGKTPKMLKKNLQWDDDYTNKVISTYKGEQKKDTGCIKVFCNFCESLIS